MIESRFKLKPSSEYCHLYHSIIILYRYKVQPHYKTTMQSDQTLKFTCVWHDKAFLCIYSIFGSRVFILLSTQYFLKETRYPVVKIPVVQCINKHNSCNRLKCVPQGDMSCPNTWNL